MTAYEGSFATWDEFKLFTGRYARLPHPRHESFIFRGQREWTWSLNSTLDRWLAENGRPPESRVDESARLLSLFQRELRRLEHPAAKLDLQPLMTFARHHGLPTPLIDWTRSPYVAAYFALADDSANSSDAAFWVIDRDVFLTTDASDAELQDSEANDASPRESAQQGVFVKMTGKSSDLERVLHGGLWKFRLPRSCRREALLDLQSMGINATALFRDAAGAATGAMTARTIQWGTNVESV